MNTSELFPHKPKHEVRQIFTNFASENGRPRFLAPASQHRSQGQAPGSERWPLEWTEKRGKDEPNMVLKEITWDINICLCIYI